MINHSLGDKSISVLYFLSQSSSSCTAYDLGIDIILWTYTRLIKDDLMYRRIPISIRLRTLRSIERSLSLFFFMKSSSQLEDIRILPSSYALVSSKDVWTRQSPTTHRYFFSIPSCHVPSQQMIILLGRTICLSSNVRLFPECRQQLWEWTECVAVKFARIIPFSAPWLLYPECDEFSESLDESETRWLTLTAFTWPLAPVKGTDSGIQSVESLSIGDSDIPWPLTILWTSKFILVVGVRIV